MKPAPELLESQSASGDRERQARLGELYRRHWKELVRFLQNAFGSGPPEPEDVAQVVFRQFASLQNPDEIANPRAFLFQLARNYAIDQRRHLKVHLRFAHGADAERLNDGSSEIDPERVIRAKQRLQIVAETLKAMPAKRREFFILHRIHELSYTEIARRKRVSDVHVRNEVMAAALMCQRAIAKAEGEGK